jgi:hypothetical protein
MWISQIRNVDKSPSISCLYLTCRLLTGTYHDKLKIFTSPPVEVFAEVHRNRVSSASCLCTRSATPDGKVTMEKRREGNEHRRLMRSWHGLAEKRDFRNETHEPRFVSLAFLWLSYYDDLGVENRHAVFVSKCLCFACVLFMICGQADSYECYVKVVPGQPHQICNKFDLSQTTPKAMRVTQSQMQLSKTEKNSPSLVHVKNDC